MEDGEWKMENGGWRARNYLQSSYRSTLILNSRFPIPHSALYRDLGAGGATR